MSGAFSIGSFYPEDESHPEFFVMLNREVAAGPFLTMEEAVTVKNCLEQKGAEAGSQNGWRIQFADGSKSDPYSFENEAQDAAKHRLDAVYISRRLVGVSNADA
jgi:hypothetical protein